MIRQQIEKALNLNGKSMPSVEEEFGESFNRETVDIKDFILHPQTGSDDWKHVLSTKILKKVDDEETDVMDEFPADNIDSSRPPLFDKLLQSAQRLAESGEVYSDVYADYTEKHRSLYPDCKSLRFIGRDVNLKI